MTVRVYQYPGCSTCRKALAWLRAEGVPFEAVHIVESPPSRRVLGEVLRGSGLPVRKLFNTSGRAYREGGFGERLRSGELDEAGAIAALASDGMLVKRPLAVGEGLALVGFDPEAWKRALSPS